MFCKQKNVYMLCTYIYDGMAEEAVVVCVCVWVAGTDFTALVGW